VSKETKYEAGLPPTFGSWVTSSPVSSSLCSHKGTAVGSFATTVGIFKGSTVVGDPLAGGDTSSGIKSFSKVCEEVIDDPNELYKQGVL
jgi:hypothetical protein